MKTPIKVGLLVSGILALSSFAMSVSLVSELFRKNTVHESQSKILHHFTMFIPGNTSVYLDDMIEGAKRASKENSVALSVHRIEESGNNLRFAMYTGADGLLLCPTPDDVKMARCLTELRNRKIPIVLANHNVPADQPWPFVGTNNFDFGKKVASLIQSQPPEIARIAVIYSDKSAAIFAERELVEMGVSSALGKTLDGPIVGLKTDMNPRDAEKIVYRLVRETPSINTIVFTDSDDTIAGTQALIELNMVGTVRIIGTGDAADILDYIRKGIIAGSLMINPDAIGYQAVKSLAELCSSGYTSQSVDIGIDVITRDSLSLFRPSGAHFQSGKIIP